MMKINGHHHISMYTKDIKANQHFYTHVLGLRLVEISVNQDNPSMYHFFYGDEEGMPGTLLSFFDIPNLAPTQKGTNSIYRLSLLVPDSAALDYFETRLASFNVTSERLEYAGQPALSFLDPDNIEIILIQNDDYTYPAFWKKNSYSDIPAEYQIVGMGPVELRVKKTEPTRQFLTDILQYEERAPLHFTQDKGGLYSDLIVVEEDGPSVRPGRGYIHHIAVDVPDDSDLEAIIRYLDELPGSHSGIIDRYFFKSVYYRHNTIMYEFATSGPGFMIDTPKDELGKKLNLPDFLEPERDEIEKRLPPLT